MAAASGSGSAGSGPRTARNILFIMCDQLRWDYLGHAGHPYLDTPTIDALAARGVAFERAFVQAPVCGGSRMCFYTGRYGTTHGSHYNNFPLRVDEWMLGDYLRPLGVRTVLSGKTHFQPDIDTIKRLGIDPESEMGRHLRQGGFEIHEWDDGLHPDPSLNREQPYLVYLRELGYDSENPWHDFANSAEGPDGEVLSGWHMRYARLPARVKEEHSETPYMTNKCMELIDELGETPWCIHLSYIKPHWPYVAPAPYHALYDNAQVLPPNRTDAERDDPHPVMAAFMKHGESACFAEDECRETVIPTYMGLIRQIDDHLGRLMTFLEERGRLDDTMIVFTSDHGDYLGDHWLGEKDLFHEEIVRVPMIIVDPSADADATRGTRSSALVESIDLIPTFIDRLGGDIPTHRLEGRSLMPWLRGEQPDAWRDTVFCDGDFSVRTARWELELEPVEARGFMARTERYKYVEFIKHPPQLFDLENDPHELHDLGRDPAYAAVRADMHERLFRWFRGRRLRTTRSEAFLDKATGGAPRRGIHFGVW
ncbi:MAG: sulfatase-like hydrolase/transferase [Pseudomonadota bacterium]